MSGSKASAFPSLHLSSQPFAAIYPSKSRKLLYEISHLNDNTWLWLTLHPFRHLHLLPSREYNWWLHGVLSHSGLMEVFLQNFICLKTILQILLKSGRLGLVCIVGRVENQFTMSLINSKLHNAGCSLLQDVLKACCLSITDASIQKAKRLNSKKNFVDKGKQPCS